jgi:hypothetical protein
MRRVILIAVAGLGLAGCSSFSMDYFRPTPPPLTVQLESAPQGAEARTSLGPGCKTPCSVSIPAADNFTVTYTLNRFQPLTVPVQVIRIPGDFSTPASTTIDPNPVVGELRPAVPPKPVRKPMRPKKPKPKPAAAPAASPFPTPAAPVPAPTR